MRSIWNGTISWGLVSVPVKMFGATESHDVELHQVHKIDAGRVRYKKFCEDCGEELHGTDVGKGYEHPSGQMKILSEDELAILSGDGSREAEVLAFVPANSVDILLIEKSYYLEPNRSAKAYQLLIAAMQKTKREAIVRFTLRSVERIGLLRIRKIGAVDVLMLHALLWADEVRQPKFPELTQSAPIRPEELAAAKNLVESLAADWRPQDYADERQDTIKDRLANPRRRKKSEPVVDDLLAKLEQSKKRSAA